MNAVNVDKLSAQRETWLRACAATVARKAERAETLGRLDRSVAAAEARETEEHVALQKLIADQKAQADAFLVVASDDELARAAGVLKKQDDEAKPKPATPGEGENADLPAGYADKLTAHEAAAAAAKTGDAPLTPRRPVTFQDPNKVKPGPADTGFGGPERTTQGGG